MSEYWADNTSIISEKSVIGENTKIWQFCTIMDQAIIGRNCSIGQHVFIESGVKIGNGVKIKNNISLYTGVICEDDVFLGPNCVFTNVMNPRSFIEKKAEFKTTKIKKGATIGANATLICGVTIGKYAMVGAGAVITKSVPDYALVVGNPGHQIGYVCYCGETLGHFDGYFQCSICKRKYKHLKHALVKEEGI